MARTLDTVAFYLSFAVLLFLGAAYISNRYWIGFAVAVCGTMTVLLWRKTRRRINAPIGYADFCRMLLLEGNGGSDPLVRQLFVATSTQDEWGYFDANGNYVVNVLHNGKIKEEWAAKLYRAHKDAPIENLILLATEVDRQAIPILLLCAKRIRIVRVAELYRMLKKQNLLRPYPLPKWRWNRQVWLSGLSLRHVGLLALSSIYCLVFSFLVPFRTYYYVMAAVSAAIGVGLLILKRVKC